MIYYVNINTFFTKRDKSYFVSVNVVGKRAKVTLRNTAIYGIIGGMEMISFFHENSHFQTFNIRHPGHVRICLIPFPFDEICFINVGNEYISSIFYGFINVFNKLYEPFLTAIFSYAGILASHTVMV